MTGGSASLEWFQLCCGLEGLESHVRQMTIRLELWVGAGISVCGIREDNSLRVWPVRQWVWQREVELCQAGLKGVQALWEDGGHWGGDGGGGSGRGWRGQGFALRVGLTVGKTRLHALPWTLHPQKPGNPLQQN